MRHAEGFGDFEPRFREEAASARGDAGGAAPARAARSAQDEKSARLQRLATKIDNERETVTPSSRISAEVLPQLHFAIDITDKKSRRRRCELVLGCIEADFSTHIFISAHLSRSARFHTNPHRPKLNFFALSARSGR